MMHKGCCKGLLAGLLFGFYTWVVGFVVWAVLFKQETAAFAHLWRTEDDPKMLSFILLGNLVIGVGAAVAFKFFSKGYCGECNVQRGLTFGVILWVMLGLGKALVCYGVHPISTLLFFAQLTDGVISYLGGGVLLSMILGNCCDAAKSCDMEKSAPAKKLAITKKPAKKASSKKPAKKS